MGSHTIIHTIPLMERIRVELLLHVCHSSLCICVTQRMARQLSRTYLRHPTLQSIYRAPRESSRKVPGSWGRYVVHLSIVIVVIEMLLPLGYHNFHHTFPWVSIDA